MKILPVYVLFLWTGGLNGHARRITKVFAIQMKQEVGVKTFLIEAYEVKMAKFQKP